MEGTKTNESLKRRIQTGQTGGTTVSSDPSLINDPDLKGEKTSKPADQGRAKTATIAAAILSPALVTSLLLIFGGCCSNVYALEAIVKLSPGSGTLVTFLQFLLTALSTFPSQLTTKSSTNKSAFGFVPRLRPRIIPLYKWIIYTAFFLTINMLNNLVFNYRISIPLHIILRSASPVTSMLVGYLVAGRRYTPRQIFAVLLLFVGVVVAALSDADKKNKIIGDDDATVALYGSDWAGGTIQAIKSALTSSDLAHQFPGFVLLFSALILAAVMGVYTDRLYDQHGRSIEVTNENLFYSHMLSMPWFAFQRSKLQAEYSSLAHSATESVEPSTIATSIVVYFATHFPKLVLRLPSSVLMLLSPSSLTVLWLLLLNALTQIVCITGVNRLSTETTSLTVTIVLNVRKLVSLLLSIWLFGNTMSIGVVIGAVMVFVGGGLYGLSGRQKKEKKS